MFKRRARASRFNRDDLFGAADGLARRLATSSSGWNGSSKLSRPNARTVSCRASDRAVVRALNPAGLEGLFAKDGDRGLIHVVSRCEEAFGRPREAQ